MLYRLKLNGDDGSSLDPLNFYEFQELEKLEKDLENLIANNLLNNLFEDNALMPIHQERTFQGEADIYALTSSGDLVIFELKRGIVGDDAMLQILRYTQIAGQWKYNKLNDLFKSKHADKELATAHRESFGLEQELTHTEFNKNQHLYVVGSAANDALSKSLTYWKAKGLSVEFIPYRVYKISEELYFEFFAKPNDVHLNPKQTKGVILDTNSTYDENGIWHMLEHNRACIWGDISTNIQTFRKNDYVFLSHRGVGVVAAGQVISTPKFADGGNEGFVDVRWLTNIPTRSTGIQKAMPFAEVSSLLEQSFYWARTLKVPYLSIEESKLLLDKLKTTLLS